MIGGGVGGASVAYHLAELGLTDTVVLEQHELSDGTTWHSAGFVGQLRSSISQTRMIMYSTELYERLAAETGLDPGLARGRRPAGRDDAGAGRGAAPPAERRRDLRAASSTCSTPAETKERLPLLEVDDILAAAWLPGDGYVDPELLNRALGEGRRPARCERSTPASG